MKLLRSLLVAVLVSGVGFSAYGQSVSATYSTGDIPTINGSAYNPGCIGTLAVTLPGGNDWLVTGVAVVYNMTAAGGAYKADQRSQIYCVNTTTNEGSYASGTGNAGGTLGYSRTGLTLANGAYPANSVLTFEMRAYRTYAVVAGCNTTYNKVDDGTWTVTVYYSVAPSCLPPTSLMASNITSTTANLGWTSGGSGETAWDIELGTTGFTPTGTATQSGVTNPYTYSSLTANTSYNYYVRANCGGSGTSSWSGPYTFYTGYCAVTSGGSSTFINGFSTTNGAINITNTNSGYTTGGYQDATAMIVSQQPGGSITWSLDGNQANGGGFGIWIDWNNDLIFDNATEKVFTSNTYVDNLSGETITVPGAQALGNYRMRIRYDYYSPNPSACGPGASSNRNETEDYTFTVSNVLPVELTTFTATQAENRNALIWETASEANNSYFDVERSTNGVDFETIGKVQGNGTTAETSKYRFNDETPTTVSYYRLRQVDFDGNFENSNIVIVKRDRITNKEVILYPVPFRNRLMVQYETATSEEMTITVMDITGRRLITKTVKEEEGENQFYIDFTELPAGSYFVRLQSGLNNTVKIVVKDSSN